LLGVGEGLLERRREGNVEGVAEGVGGVERAMGGGIGAREGEGAQRGDGAVGGRGLEEQRLEAPDGLAVGGEACAVEGEAEDGI